MEDHSELEAKIRARLLTFPAPCDWYEAYNLLHGRLDSDIEIPRPAILAAWSAPDLQKSDVLIEQLDVAEANGLKQYFLSVLSRIPEERWFLGPPPPLPPTKAERQAAKLEQQIAERNRIYDSYSQASESGNASLAAELPNAIKDGRLSDVANIVDHLSDLAGVTNMVGKLSSYATMHKQHELAEYLKSRGL